MRKDNTSPKNNKSKGNYGNNKRSANNKRYGGSFKNDRKGSDVYSESDSKNDPSWYGADPSLLRDAASIPFSSAIGTSVDYGIPGISDTSKSIYDQGTRHAIPGVASFRIAPMFGFSDSGNSPINIAANAIYSFLRQANSGAKNYDAPDMMLYCLAMTQVYSYITWLQRLYGYATLYVQRNRYLPKAIIHQNMVSYNDIMNSLASFRYAINLLINKASSLAVPGDMTIFQRHAFLYRDIYSEGDSIKDQLYQMVPDGFFYFKLNDNKSGMLNYAGLVNYATVEGEAPGKLLSVKNLIDYGNMLLDPLITSEDFNIMSGDILKAYGDNVIKLTSLPTEYPVVPVHDYTVLQQLKNCTIIANELSVMQLVQSADVSYLEFRPQVPKNAETSTIVQRVTAKLEYSNPIISVGTNDPDPGEIMEVTRLKATRREFPGQEVSDYINCGTEIVRSVFLTFIDTVDGTEKSTAFTSNAAIFPQGVDNASSGFALAKASNFKYAPALYLFHSPADKGLAVVDFFMGVAWDFDNYSVITPKILERLHEAAIMNMLHVPHITKLG